MPNFWRLILDKILGHRQNKKLVAYVEDRIEWTDIKLSNGESTIETVTTLLYQDQYNRRYIEIVRYGTALTVKYTPKSIGAIKVWQNGGDFPIKAKRISRDIRNNLKLIG